MPNKTILIFFAKIILYHTKHTKPIIYIYIRILPIEKMSPILTIKCRQ